MKVLGRREYWQPHTLTCIESKVEQGVDGSERNANQAVGEAFVFRYITTTSSSRIATAYQLGRLGVVTALTLTLINDELACDPFSTPQQLLILQGTETA
eukprot:scaffold2203_cov90-Skeletonema_dohrnii-CCMP3373.AAC.6